MIPAIVTVMDAILLNANGKVGKRKLPTPEFNKEECTKDISDRQKTLLEEKLSAVVAESLGHDDFSI